ncbi:MULTISPECIES: hypothetical protein [unclassified Streptomyces]|uniref:hypothetical protein n=1 Tax=unclassified Streptomyces TaxID=2593676 RepID=UPI00225B9316|nr:MULTISPECIES: hypothetical protein [unclassified Streptomyces]MCX5052100.1 hypothetical protein [Streptomyces sp. NBC_00474]
MTFSTDTAAGQVVGFQAGWALVFRKDNGKGFPDESAPALRLSHADYPAELAIEADNNLRGATFDITVDGMRDRDYHAIAHGEYMHVEIRLGWWDRGLGFVQAALAAVGAVLPGAPGGEKDGLETVLHGRVLRVERAHGEFTYRARFSGIDSAFHRMRCRKPQHPINPKQRTVIGYATELCVTDTAVGIPVDSEGQDIPVERKLEAGAADSVVKILGQVAQLTHGGPERFKVPMFLRLGRLHVGRAKGKVKDGHRWELTPQTGLVESRPLIEPDPDAKVLGSPFATPKVRRFILTLLGRPDIAVGDVVRADLPNPSPAGLTDTLATSAIGPLGDVFTGPDDRNPLDYTVVGFVHKLGPATGFVTRLTVQCGPADDRPALGTRSGSSDEASRLAAALAEERRQAAAERRTHEVGMVRRQDVAATFRDGHDVPAQSLAVDEGLADTPSPNVPARAAPSTTPTQLVDKPYLTPYAYGGTGLVVPHYPGMRVMSLHYREELQNAVVAGALWEDGAAPRSHLGDWWLSLPTNLAGTDDSGESAPDPASAPRPTGPASHDLINGLGNRVIQVGGLRITVGRGLMKPVGQRPDDAADGELIIEHAVANARISMDGHGNIEISTDANLTLAAEKITFRTNSVVEVP